MQHSAESLYNALGAITIGGNTCIYTLEKCATLAPLINQINQLKKEKNAIILAHSYVSPEILHGVADVVGDSYELSKKAKETNAEIIVFVAVKFMAETAKLLNPEKTVLIPSKINGCSLADSINEVDVQTLKKQYPHHTFVCYINTSAAVKAECDVCVTSSNVVEVIKKIPNENIYFLPDALMAKNVINELSAQGIKKNISYWEGSCYVHEDYDPELITYLKLNHPELKVVSHPECAPEILSNSDYVGSTSQMINYVKKSESDTFLLLTECGLSGRLALETTGKKFIGSCTMCRYMKANHCQDILRVLQTPKESDIITIDASTQAKALHCIEEMFRLTSPSAS